MPVAVPDQSSAPAPAPLASGDKTQGAIFKAIDAADDRLVALNEAIHANPELAFEEHKARDALVEALAALGFTVTNPTSLPTAFVGTYTHGIGGRAVGVNAEYDALPDMGHACGHNLIATVAIATAVGLKAGLEARDIPGTVKVIGSPAEEAGGGKIILLNEGVYDGLDACVMAHPGSGFGAKGTDGTMCTGIAASLARASFTVDFVGKAAHAGGAPWKGVNALDAAVQGYTAVSMLRQQLEPDMRVHGIIQGSERWATNIIPAHARVSYSVRAADIAQTLALRKRVVACFETAAVATGCTAAVDLLDSENYAELQHNTPLADAYADTMTAVFGQRIDRAGAMTASTDFGNVTYKCPGIHPLYNIEADGFNHTPEFTAGAGTPAAHALSIVVAKGLALVGMRVLSDDAFAASVAKAHEAFLHDVEAKARGE